MRRYSNETFTTFYTYDGEKPIYEWTYDGKRGGWNLYGKGIDEIVLRSDYVVVPQGQGYFYQQDHEGSVTNLMSFEGTKIESYRYDAFGQPTTTYTGGSFNNRFRFTGREYAEQFGVYEYRNRAYHPGLGRFTNEDPKGFEAGDYNLFRYCANDPVDRVDPMGLTDIQISPEVMQKIWEASNNSVIESSRKGDGAGRGQVVEHKIDSQGNAVGKPVLQNKFEKGIIVYKPREEYRKSFKGESHRIVMQEGPYQADAGHKMDAVGHGHQDVTGKPRAEAKFSQDDRNTARGAPGVEGLPVGRIDESKKRELHVLVPQVEHTEPQERTFSATRFEDVRPKGQ